MDKFKYKTYRCEWQLQFITVDQYGKTMRVDRVIPFATYDEAKEARPNYAVEHKYVKERWIPKDATNDYQEVEISYREVEVK